MKPAFATGDILRGKYRLEQVLGRGGMGTVHLATHLVIGQRVAIKILDAPASGEAAGAARFLREARAAALLESEHVVRILDVDAMDDGTPFMVMECLHGSDLGAMLRTGGRFPLPEAVSYVLQTCEALAEAHAAGIVHRDLKPSNLFLAQTARAEPIVKLLDFGISKLDVAGEDLSLTDTHAVIGSPLFMSPEQLLSTRDVDARTDIWSLGVTLYQLASGTLPFEASSASALGAQIATKAPRRLAEALPGVPQDLEAAVMRCLARDRGERFGDVASFARALAPYAPADAVAAVERAAARGAQGRPPVSVGNAAAPAAIEASGERWTRSRASSPPAGLETLPATPAPAVFSRDSIREAVPEAPRSRRRGPVVAGGVALVIVAAIVSAWIVVRGRAERGRDVATTTTREGATGEGVGAPAGASAGASASASASAGVRASERARPAESAGGRRGAPARAAKPGSWSKDPSELELK